MPEKTTAATRLLNLLVEAGYDTVFGIPGVHTLALYRDLGRSGLRHVNARHEQGAAFMADGYARASGKPGVCFLISGPGVTNATTPIGQAFSDSIPMLVVSSAIDLSHTGLSRGMLHEISDQSAVTAPLTVFSATAYTPLHISEYFAHAQALFASSRARPVHVSIPIDVLDAASPPFAHRKALPSAPEPNKAEIKRAAALLAAASRPMIVVGGGAKDASAEVIALAERLEALVVSTIAGKGVVPESHRLSLGATMPRPETRRLVEVEADLVLAIGTELSEPDLYVAADAEATAGGVVADVTRLTLAGRFIRVDIDPATTVRDYVPEVALCSDAGKAASALVDALTRHDVMSSWTVDAAQHRRALRTATSPLEKRHIAILDAIREALPIDAMVYCDGTQLAYTSCVFFPVDRPRSYMYPAGYGTLGYGVPAAIGGALACPDRSCVVIAGDGGFMFTLPELAGAVELGLPMAIFLWDNDGFGEIDDLMRSRQIPAIGVKPRNPDFRQVAASFGCHLSEPTSIPTLTDAIHAALAADRPTIIYLRQDAF